MLHLPRIVLLFFFLCNHAIAQFPTAVQKFGVANTQWRALPTGLLVYGFSDGSIQTTLYNKQLQAVANYSKKIPEFEASEIELYYCGNAYCEFLLKNTARQNVFLRLDQQLKEIFISAPFTPAQKERDDSLFSYSPAHLEKTTTHARFDNEEWELCNETTRDAKGKITTKTFFRKSRELRNETFPVFQQSWKYELERASPEYAKIILSDKNRIYFYVNFNTDASEQYIYCLNCSDGTLIYKSKLHIEGGKACLYSNHYYNAAAQRLIIGGTIAAKPGTLGVPGFFLNEIDAQGRIAKAGYYSAVVVLYDNNDPQYRLSNGAFAVRNNRTYSRFVSLKQRPDGSLHALMECYSYIQKLKPVKGQIELQDSSYHYLLLESVSIDAIPSPEKPEGRLGGFMTQNYSGGANFNGVANVNLKEAKIIDRPYESDINRLNDPAAGDHYFIGSAEDKTTKGTKTLLKFSVQSGNITNDLYYKAYFTGNKLETSLKPFPLPGQDLLVRTNFLVRDDKTLYKLTPSATGYKLEVVEW